MDVLSSQINFRSLSMKDLLQARDLYHWHLMNKANVIGTAVGLYLIRDGDPDGEKQPSPRRGSRAAAGSAPRTFENSRVRPNSWPCIIVLVKEWCEVSRFGGDGIDPSRMVPRTLYLPDGRAAPVCVVLAKPGEVDAKAPADIRWPGSYLGGGCPLVATVQQRQHVASVGCLVTDGHKTYALTNRHVAGEAGNILQAKVRGQLRDIGISSAKQAVKAPFTAVFPEFPGHRTFLAMDVGLVDLEAVDDWTSQPFGLPYPVGDVADLNELNLGLQLIDQPVHAFGAASGLLKGTIKALFYRHKSRAGYDYISEFLIAPQGGTQTEPGDSGTVWHLETHGGNDGKNPLLRPLAVEWGGQAIESSVDPGSRFNFALATGLSTVCERLDVDLVTDHNVGATPFWGQTGHYGIATAAIGRIANRDLAALLGANIARISFTPDELTPDEIREKLRQGDFVELADVPDLVWKKVAADVPGGRDYARNSGPEHPNHYADIDAPALDGGPTLRDLTLQDIANMSVEVWLNWYKANGQTAARDEGLLPFRVWQLFDVMVAALRDRDVARFVCAAGIVSHYVGDACQPLHGSYRADGFKEQAESGAKKWPGKGVHSTYEDKMVDRFSADLLPKIDPEAKAFAGQVPRMTTGQEAAFATVTLMGEVAKVIPPEELCREYIRLGGGSSKPVVQGLWDAFGGRTAKVMGIGARYLAALWDAAFVVAGTPLPSKDAVSEADLKKIYQDPTFAPSLTLNKIASELATPPTTPAPSPARAASGARRTSRGHASAARPPRLR